MFQVKDIRKIDIETINNCNAGCPLCLRHPGMKTNDSLDWDAIVQQIPDVVWTNVEEINFNGTTGDNLMHPRILSIIDWVVKNTNALVSVHTNGSIRDASWWAVLGSVMANSSHRMVFGIDGLEDTHSTYRVNTDWNKIIDNAKAFISSGGRAHWQFIVFEHNIHQIEECQRLSKELGFEHFFVLYQDRFENTDHTNNHIRKADITAIPQTVHFIEREFINPPTGRVVCQSQQTGWISIYADGTVWPCCWLMGWHKAKHKGLTYEAVNYHFQKFLKIDLDQINLYTNRLEDIIDGDLWQKRYPDSFVTTPNLICTQKCPK
jgi:MoaA/NifB/PqqE/SkfB family radical SAM enzyme